MMLSEKLSEKLPEKLPKEEEKNDDLIIGIKDDEQYCLVCFEKNKIYWHVHSCGVYPFHKQCINSWYKKNKECIICRKFVVVKIKLKKRQSKYLKRYAIVDPIINLQKNIILNKYNTEYSSNPHCFTTHVIVTESTNRAKFIICILSSVIFFISFFIFIITMFK